MKDRLITLLGAVIAFYILFRLLVPQIGFDDKKLSFPTTEDRGRYGLAGLSHWLGTQHIPVYALRKRYDTLNHDPSLPEQGNLLVISLPLRMQAQVRELNQLQRWVNRGNTVILLAAMSDWPEWASRTMGDSFTQLLNNFDLRMISATPETQSDRKNARTADSVDVLLHPVAHKRDLIPDLPHPLTLDVHDVSVTWLSSEGRHWHLQGTNKLRSTLVLLRDKFDKSPGLWLSFYGQGHVLISRHSDLFGNVSLGEADNARLFANIIRQMLNTKGKVIFDDMHQGLSVLYDPQAFYHDPRLHHTLLFLLALWIVYIMGHTNRFGQVRQRKPAMQLRQHVSAIGNLFARRLHSSAAALRYARHFFNEVRASYGLPLNGQPVWEQLQYNATIPAPVLERAQHLYQRALHQKRVNLIQFVNTLKIIRRELQ